MTVKQAREQLESVREEWRALVSEGRGEDVIEAAIAMMGELQAQTIELELRIAQLRREWALKRTETIDPDQLSLMLERLGDSEGEEGDFRATEADDETLGAEFEALDTEAPPPVRRRPHRRRAPKELPRDILRHELSPEERRCHSCGEEMAVIGEDISEVYELVPAHFRIQEHHRVKYACSRCKETVLTAPGPAKLIEKGLAGPGLLAHVVASKYQNHIPLSRLSEIYQSAGVEMATSTLCGWVAAVADEMRPLVERIWEKALSSHTLQADGSGLKVLDRDDPEGVRKGTLWCCVGDGKYVVFHYAPTGSGEDGPWRFLQGREGTIQADAASVFDRLYNGECGNATEVGCWAHARRKVYALKDSDVRVAYPLKLIAQLYRVEELADRRKVSLEGRRTLRQARSGPILGRIQRWLRRTAAKEPPESALKKACAYSLNHWEALTRFLEDPRLPLDNNLCERQIRSLAVGRKNYLFAGSDAGAENAAILYSLVRTAALARIDTYAYLKSVIEKLASGWPKGRIDELLPENYTPAVPASPDAPLVN